MTLRANGATIVQFRETGGYSDTHDGAIERAREGLAHLLDAYQADGTLVQLLKEGNVEYTLTPEKAIGPSERSLANYEIASIVA